MSDSTFDDCTAEDCPVHFRNDMESTGGEYAAITYVGEYCVYTDITAPTTAESLLNFLAGGDLTWDILVFRVGSGTLGEAAKTSKPVYSYVTGDSDTAKAIHGEFVDGIAEHGIKYVQ